MYFKNRRYQCSSLSRSDVKCNMTVNKCVFQQRKNMGMNTMNTMNTMKSSLIAMALLSSVGVVGSAAAGDTTKLVQLQWSGTVPFSPVATGDWIFVAADGVTGFVPQIGNITVANDAGDTSIKKLTMSPVQFGIKATTGALAVGEIKAYLASDVSFSGLVPSQDNAPAPSATVKVGSATLQVGAANTIKVADSSASEAAVPVSVTATGILPAGSYTEGNNVSATATLMFTAGI